MERLRDSKGKFARTVPLTKRTQAQVELFCVDCRLKICDENALGCSFRLFTSPNWQQKRKIANEKRSIGVRGKKIEALSKQILELQAKQDESRKYISRTI